MTPPFKVLVTSVGSLVGQNILDLLEPRRDHVFVAGTNLDARNGRIFRCDVAYLVPPTDQHAAFERRMLEIIADLQPDLVLSGRDHDVLVQARWHDTRPELRPCLTAGPRAAAEIMHAKLKSHAFAQEAGLAFAETATCGPGGDWQPVLALAERHGFPLLAKPNLGYGSQQVIAVQSAAALAHFPADDSYVFQEFLDPPDLPDFAAQLRRGVPLFFSIPETGQYAAQTTIGRQGEIGPIFCSLNTMVAGRCEYSERLDDPALADLSRRFAEAIAARGWQGPFNLQCKKRRDGSYAGFEMNGRMSGSTSARRHMGYDEMEILVRLLCPERRLPALPPVPASQVRVLKTLVDLPLDDVRIAHLEETGVWRAGS